MLNEGPIRILEGGAMGSGPLWHLFFIYHWRGGGLSLASTPPHFPSPVSLGRGEVRRHGNMVYSVSPRSRKGTGVGVRAPIFMDSQH